MVPMLRFHNLHTVPGIVFGIRPGPAGGSQDQPFRGIEEHLRHHHQQSDLQFRLDNPVLEQVRSTGEEGR
ncbi:rotatin [Holotrichia oblita]|uniref:Rotatin n=1 Tax=Holotrichia oblita TaxID=644536 RepID=A0ACB9T1N8_HOLOL|nr:rotatin [Holotrichia oblita]